MRRAILVLLCCFAATAFAQTRIALTGATLIDGRGGAPVKNANVIVADGKIECAGADCAVPKGAKVVDAKDMWMTPGLVDSHVHFSQTGWADGRPDALDVRALYPYEKTIADLKTHPERFAHTYLCSGVTGVFDVGGYPWTLQLASRFEKDTTAPHISAAGPLLSTLDHWLNLPAERQFIHLKDEASGRDGVKYLAAQGAKAIKVWYIVSRELPVEQSEPFVTAVGDEAKKHGLPLIVHATGLEEAKAALRAGATLLVHSVWDLHIDDEFIALAKKNGTILTPTLTVAAGYGRMFASVVGEIPTNVDDPNRCVDAQTVAKVRATGKMKDPSITVAQVLNREQRTREREQIAADNLMHLIEAGIPIATGTDAGNPLTLHGVSMYTEMEAMQKAGMSPMQVIVSSTAVAARAARFDDVTGTIEKGKDADLLLLDADPTRDVKNFRRVRFVMRAGVLRSIQELSAMAQ